MELNEFVKDLTTAGQLSNKLHYRSRKVGGTIGSGVKIAALSDKLEKGETKITGSDSQADIHNMAKQDINLKQQEKEQENKNKAAIYASKHHTPIAPVSNVSPQTNTPTISVASQNASTPPPNTAPQNKSILPAGHNPNKPKRIKTFKQMFPNK